MQIVNVAIKDIKPYHRNVRINDKTVEKLVELIPRVGFDVPIVLDKDNVIVKGHARWKALIKLGYETVPCIYSNADAETIKLNRLADNKVSEFTDWDRELLQSELASLNIDFDIQDIGFKIDTPAFYPSYPQMSQAIENYSNSHVQTSGNHAQAIQYQEPSRAFITQQDVRDVVSIRQDDYVRVTCDACSHVFFIKK